MLNLSRHKVVLSVQGWVFLAHPGLSGISDCIPEPVVWNHLGFIFGIYAKLWPLGLCFLDEVDICGLSFWVRPIWIGHPARCECTCCTLLANCSYEFYLKMDMLDEVHGRIQEASYAQLEIHKVIFPNSAEPRKLYRSANEHNPKFLIP